MVNTEKVIGFYTDVFGNEIDEYEQIERYTVWYKDCIFEGDKDGWNSAGFDNWKDAYSFYQSFGVPFNGYIQDNEYGCTFANGEWNC